MSDYAILNYGHDHYVFSADGTGKPTGAAMGSYKSVEEAQQAIKAMRPEQDSGIGTIEPIGAGFKLIHGGDLWVAYYSNAVKDREGEIFPRAETDRYIKMLNSGEWPMPELWRSHKSGTRHGEALWVGRIGLITLAIGRFDNTTIAEKYKQYYREHEQRLSHGFFFDARRKKNGVYGPYATFEISTLEPGLEANSLTFFEVKEQNMAWTDEDIKKLKEILGEADAEKTIKGTAEASKKLIDAGVAYKAMMGKEDATEPDGDEAEDPKKKKKALDTVNSKELDERFTSFEAAVKSAFGTLAQQIGAVIQPINTQNAAQQKQIDALISGVKELTTILQREFALQPAATQNPAAMTQAPNDPNLAAYQAMMAQQYGAQQQGSKEQNMPYGLFGEVLGSIGGNKAQQPPAFQMPQTMIPQMPQQPMQQPPPMPPQQPMQQQAPQQPMQPQQPQGFLDQFGILQAPPTAGLGQGFPRFPTNGQ